jgi:phosphatidylserine decarboxylase
MTSTLPLKATDEYVYASQRSFFSNCEERTQAIRHLQRMVHTKQASSAPGRSRTMRAFRALRALRPSAALRLLGHVKTFRTIRLPAGALYKVFRKAALSGSNAKKVLTRVLKATLSTAASFTVLPMSYLLAAAWPEGQSAASPVALGALRNAPANALSRWFGKFADSDRLPYVAHQRLIRMLIATYGIDVSEIERPIQSYHTLQEFFSRKLRPGARVPHPSCMLVSPCDGELLMCGQLSGRDTPVIVQVKGNSFPLQQLLNTRKSFVVHPETEQWYFLFHLRPKDYHRFHSPCDAQISEVCHTPGTLHPVTYASSKWIPDLFAQNERVAVLGSWPFGQFAMVPIGATCVGSISLEFEPTIQTNRTSSVQNLQSLFRYASGEANEENVTAVSDTYSPLSTKSLSYGEGAVALRKGDPMGWFNWGSAVVVVVETPRGTGVVVRPHDEVRVGQPLISWSNPI